MLVGVDADADASGQIFLLSNNRDDTRESTVQVRAKNQKEGKEIETEEEGKREETASQENDTHSPRDHWDWEVAIADSRFQGGCAHQRPLKVAAQCARVPISAFFCFLSSFPFFSLSFLLVLFNFPSLSFCLPTVYLSLYPLLSNFYILLLEYLSYILLNYIQIIFFQVKQSFLVFFWTNKYNSEYYITVLKLIFSSQEGFIVSITINKICS